MGGVRYLLTCVATYIAYELTHSHINAINSVLSIIYIRCYSFDVSYGSKTSVNTLTKRRSIRTAAAADTGT